MEDKSLISIISTAIITALIVGGVIYSMQNSKSKNLQKDIDDLKTQVQTDQSQAQNNQEAQNTISDLQNQIADLQSKAVENENKQNANTNPENQITDLKNKIVESNDSLKEYSNSSYKISFKYPANFVLKDSNNMYPLPDGTMNYLDRFGVEMVFLSLPKSSFSKNTDLYRADVLVSINRDVAKGDYFFKAFSKNTGKIAEEIALNKTTKIGEMTYGLAIKNGAAAGTSSQTKIYHIYQNNTWYEIQLNLWTANDGNIKHINETEIWKMFEAILQTVKFGE